MAYSAGKLLLEKEKLNPVASDKAIEQIREALNPEQTKMLSDVLEKLNPIIKAREHEAQLKAQLQSELTQLTGVFQDLVTRLSSLEHLKSENAEKERAVLNKLMEIL